MAQNLINNSPAQQQGNSHNSTNAATTQNSNNNNGVNTTATTTTKLTPNQERILVLKQKRLDLEKRLQERTNLLQELCRKEAQLIGVYPTVLEAGTTNSAENEIGSSSTGTTNTNSNSSKSHGGHSTHSLPRKIGTGFTLSEKYLNKRTPSANSPLNAAPGSKEEEELNNLLLQRDIQQQICKASLKLLNDTALTKSVRRKHKHSYEAAQQKLMEISQGLTVIKKKHSQQQQHYDAQNQSKTLPLAVKTNFKVPHLPDDVNSAAADAHNQSPMLMHRDGYAHSPNYYGDQQQQHPMYLNQNNAAAAAAAASPVDQKSLYRSTSNSSSLGNVALGKSSLSLDNATNTVLHYQHPQQQQQSVGGGHKVGMASYESKSLHNFVMTGHYPTPALLSPTYYQSNAMATAQYHAHHHHMQQQQQAYPAKQHLVAPVIQKKQQFNAAAASSSSQFVIPNSGLGGYWMINEHNERVWCSSNSYSPDTSPSGGAGATTHRFASLDRKAAIYIPNTAAASAASHGKSKMPSPKASPTSTMTAQHHNLAQSSMMIHHQQQQQQPALNHYAEQYCPGKSFAIQPTKSTSLGNFDFLHAATSEDTQSMNSFNSDSNNNHTQHHHHQQQHLGMYYNKDFDADGMNGNAVVAAADPPPPLRPKSSTVMAGGGGAAPVVPMRSPLDADKHWYETSLDAVVPANKMKMQQSRDGTMVRQQHQQQHLPPVHNLHIDIPPANGGQQPVPLERSMSHRLLDATTMAVNNSNNNVNNNNNSPPPPPLPPPTVIRQSLYHQQHQLPPEMLPRSPILNSPQKQQPKGSIGGGNNNGNAMVRRTVSNAVSLSAASQQQLSPALASPKLVSGATATAAAAPPAGVESPKNMTVVQPGKFQPYKEESKPFEMSDFYKYSTKFRNSNGGPGTTGGTLPHSQQQQQQQLLQHHNTSGGGSNSNNNNSMYSDMDNNNIIQKAVYQPQSPSICHPISYQ